MSSEAKARPGMLATIYPVVALVVICMVAGALLGIVHQVTEPVAAANQREREQMVFAELIPEAAAFEEVPCNVEGCVSALAAKDGGGTPLGYVVVAQSKGYGGQVPLAVAFSPDGTVINVIAMSNEETPGLGTKIAENFYVGQFIGLAAAPLTAEGVDLISGATISSKAALAAYNIAVQAFAEVS